jgi:hypothetical protein
MPPTAGQREDRLAANFRTTILGNSHPRSCTSFGIESPIKRMQRNRISLGHDRKEGTHRYVRPGGTPWDGMHGYNKELEGEAGRELDSLVSTKMHPSQERSRLVAGRDGQRRR